MTSLQRVALELRDWDYEQWTKERADMEPKCLEHPTKACTSSSIWRLSLD